MWYSGRLLAVECLGNRSVEMHRVVRWTAGSKCSLCSQLSVATQRGPVGLQESECGLCSQLAGAAQRGLEGLQVSECGLCSQLSKAVQKSLVGL